MGCFGDGSRDSRVIYLGAIARRRVAPDMGAMPVHASLGLTGTAGAAAGRPCYRPSLPPRPPRPSLHWPRLHPSLYSASHWNRTRRRESWAWVFAQQDAICYLSHSRLREQGEISTETTYSWPDTIAHTMALDRTHAVLVLYPSTSPSSQMLRRLFTSCIARPETLRVARSWHVARSRYCASMLTATSKPCFDSTKYWCCNIGHHARACWQ